MKVPKLGVRLLLTGVVVVAAAIAVGVLWRRYVERPWTRMGQVQANVIRIAPRVAGVVVKVAVADNQLVRKGDLLGTITDPMNNARTELFSPYSGRIIGMARNQVVMPGFATFHVGIQADVIQEEDATPPDSEQKSSVGGYVDGMSE